MTNSKNRVSIKTGSRLLCVWVIFINNVLQIESQHLSITPHGTQIKTIASGMIFTCTIVDHESAAATAAEPIISWLGPRRQQITATVGRVYVERADKWNLRLYITKIEESDAGLYTCHSQMNSTNELMMMKETRMFLYEDIQFVDTPTETRNLLGTNAFLECIASGQPNPEISWRFNRRRITPDGVKYTVEGGGLRINRIDLTDNGTYECRAEVESHGNVKIRTIDVNVIYPPVITQSPKADVVVKGKDTTLECTADGNPVPHYEWFKEQRMSEMIRVKVRLAEATSVYVIRHVSAEDEGRYFCRVSNYLGTKESYVDIKMLVAPKIVTLPEKITVAEGKSVSFVCEATGIPIPKIHWKLSTSKGEENKDSQLMKMGVWSERQTRPGTSTVTVGNAERSFAGTISCVAHNTAGSETRDADFSVEYAPFIDLGLTEQIGWTGQTRNFSCVGRGVPTPTINWFREEQYLSDSDVYRIATTKADVVKSMLVIKLLENVSWIYGGYSCIAKNVHGYATKDVRLTEAMPPDTVRNVSVERETPTSVTLTAVAPSKNGGLPITSWMVTYETDLPDEKPHSQIFPYAERLQVNNLTSGSSYTFYLSASNAVGLSQPVKFRVTTPRKSTLSTALKEQADVPERRNANETISDNSSPIEEKKEPHKKNKTLQSPEGGDLRINKSLIPEGGGGGNVVLAIVVGSAVVVIAVVVAAFCGLWWRRRKGQRTWYAPSSASTPSYRQSDPQYYLGRPMENCIVLLPTSRQPNDPLPDVAGRYDVTRSPQPEILSECLAMKSSRPEARTLPMPTKSRTSSPMVSRICETSYRTIQRCESGRSEHGAGARAGADVASAAARDPDDACSGLPPPPAAFTLQPIEGRNAMKTGGRAGGVKAALFVDEILDGYHSGDNVDDDIDQVDYTIKIPSYHDSNNKFI